MSEQTDKADWRLTSNTHFHMTPSYVFTDAANKKKWCHKTLIYRV